MKIRFVIVSPGTLVATVRGEVDALRSAVSSGDMDAVDQATAKLLALTVDCRAVDLSEQEWREFLAGVRNRHPSFQSDYLLPGEICASIMPEVAADDLVLELPMDNETGKEGARV